jgi:hypothetical protein
MADKVIRVSNVWKVEQQVVGDDVVLRLYANHGSQSVRAEITLDCYTAPETVKKVRQAVDAHIAKWQRAKDEMQ